MKTLQIDPSEDLFDQIERAVSDINKLYAAAKGADDYLCGLISQSAVKQEEMMSDLSFTTLQRVDLENPDTLKIALACAAVVECKRRPKARPYTESELALQALAILSEKYSSDL